MTEKFGNDFLTEIRNAYGSLSSPNWSFSEKRYVNHPYIGLIHQLENLVETQETTDLNVDVSVVLFVNPADERGVTIRLSLVGSYACLSDSMGRFLSQLELMKNEFTRRILDLLKDANVVLVEPVTLAERMHFGNAEATFYELLFSADEAMG